MPNRPKFDRPPFKRKSFGEKLSFFAGPDLTRGAQGVGTLLQGLLEFGSPAGDIQDAVQSSRETSRSALRGDIPGAISNLGLTGASLLGAMVPAPPISKTKSLLESAGRKFPKIKIGGQKISLKDRQLLSRADQRRDFPFLVFNSREEKGFEGVFSTAEEALAFIKKQPNSRSLDFGTPRDIESLNPSGEETPAFIVQELRRIIREVRTVNKK